MIELHKSSRHPFEVLVVGFCVYSGAAQTFSRSAPSVVADAVSPVFQTAFSATMLVAGLLALVGIVLRDPEDGLHFELSGMIGLGTANLVYGTTVILQAPVPVASYAGPITLGIGVACFWRAWRIARRLWELRRNPVKVHLEDAVRSQLNIAAKSEIQSIADSIEEDRVKEAARRAREVENE